MQCKNPIVRCLFLLMLLGGFSACHTTNKSTDAEKEQETEQKTEKTKATETLPNDNNEEKDYVHDATKASQLIVGKWKWEKTICCSRMPEVITPDKDEKIQYLEFTPDSTVIFYKGNEVQKRKTYRVNEGPLVPNMPEINIEGQRTGILRITDDQLVLDYSYIDLQTEYYDRVE